MRIFAGILIFLVSLVIALFLGVFVMFVGGVDQLIDGINANPANGEDIAWGSLRILFASAVTVFTVTLGGILALFVTDEW